MGQSASGDPDDLETLFAGLDSDRDGQLQREEVQVRRRCTVEHKFVIGMVGGRRDPPNATK
jgi:hypothetical protein